MPLSLPNKDKKKKKIDEVEERLSPKKVSDLSFSEARAIREQYGSLKNYELATDKNMAKRIDEQMQDLNARRLVDAATSRGTPVEAESYGKNNKWNDYTTVMGERKSDYDRAVEKLKKDLDVYSPIADVSGAKNYLDATKAGYDNVVAFGKSAADFGNAFKSADDFKRWSIGWDGRREGDKTFVDDDEKKEAREEYYKNIVNEIGELVNQLEFHDYKGRTPEEIQDRIDQLTAEKLRYERFDQIGREDDKLRSSPDFAEKSAFNYSGTPASATNIDVYERLAKGNAESGYGGLTDEEAYINSLAGIDEEGQYKKATEKEKERTSWMSIDPDRVFREAAHVEDTPLGVYQEGDTPIARYLDDYKKEKKQKVSDAQANGATIAPMPDNINPGPRRADESFDIVGEYILARNEETDSNPFVYVGGNLINILDYGDGMNLDFMTEDDLATYRYVLNTQGATAAKTWLDNHRDIFVRRADAAYREKLKDESALGLAARSIASVPENLVGGIGAFIGTALGDGSYDSTSWMQRRAEGARAETAQRIDKATGDANLFGFSFGDVYQSLMSGADSLAGAALLGKGYTYVMGTGAAASKARTLYDQGATEEQIHKGAFVAGLTEILTEKVSAEVFFSNFIQSTTKSGWQGALKVATQAFTEGTEEMASDALNAVFDNIIRRSQSEWNQTIQRALDQGKTRKEAERLVWTDFANQLWQSFAGGALSGGMMAGPGTIASGIEYSRATNAEGNYIIDSEGVEALRNIANEMTDASKSVSKLIEKTGKKPTAKNVGKLSRALEQTIVNETDAETRSEKGAKYALAREGVDLSDIKAREGTNLYNNVDVSEKISDTGTTVDTETGGEITIDETNPITQRDGKTYLNTSAGEILQDDIKYSSEKEAQLYEYVSDLPQSVANAIVKNYKGQENVRGYVNGMRDGILLYGYNNIENAPKNTAFATLSKADQQYALKAGRLLAAEDLNNAKPQTVGNHVAVKETATTSGERVMNLSEIGLKATPAVAKKIGAGGTAGAVYTKGDVDLNSAMGRADGLLAYVYSSIAGNSVVLYDSKTAKDADLKNANGKHVASDGTIYLDVRAEAGNNVTGGIAYTLGHELTHEAEQWAKKEYAAFRKFLYENYMEVSGKTKWTVEDLIAKKMSDLDTTDRAYAESELVADACERMLLDSDAMEKLAELRDKEPGTFKKIVDFIKRALEKIVGKFNSIREVYETLGAENTRIESKLVQEFGDNLKKLQDMWSDMVVKAAQNRAAAVETKQTTEAKEAPVEFSIKHRAEIADVSEAYAYEHRDKLTFDYELVAKAEEEIDKIATDIETKLKGKTDKNGQPLIPEETKLSNNIFSNSSYLKDAEPTTECWRQMVYRDLYRRVTDKLGRPLTTKEAVVVNQAAIEIGVDSPCLYCYSLLDRKAKEGYKLQYLAERDGFLKNLDKDFKGDVEAFKRQRSKVFDYYKQRYLSRVDDPSAYDENGVYDKSKARTENWAKEKRVNLWLDVYENLYKNGNALNANDIRNVEAEGESKAAFSNIEDNAIRDLKLRELKDALDWAQASSQAKKLIPYSAYSNFSRDSILNWSKATINKLNSEYGLRWYSHADYHPAFVVDNMQQVVDASLLGLKGLMYCKPTEIAKIMAPTGMNINVSCFVQVDPETGDFVEDAKMGAPWKEVQDLRKEHKNVGAVMVVTSDEQMFWALTQDWIDVVIPIHLVRAGDEFLKEFGLTNYTSEQADKLTDKQLYDKFIADVCAAKGISEDGKTGKALKKGMKTIYPTEHQNDYQTYMDAINERGLTPRFDRIRQMAENGTAEYDGVKVTPQMYMKLVNETRQSAAETSPLRPVFDNATAEDAVNEIEKKGYHDFFKEAAVNPEDGQSYDVEGWADIAARDIKAGKTGSQVGYGRNLSKDITSRRQAQKEGIGGTHDQLRYSRKSAQEKWDAGEKLTESQFYNFYSAHKLNLRGLSNIQEQIENIKSEGFKGDAGFGHNLMPTRQNTKYPTIDKYNTMLELEKEGVYEKGYADKWKAEQGEEFGKPVPSNISEAKYGPRKGDYILLVAKPGAEITKNVDRVREGYKPKFDYEIVQADYDYQPYYEMYSKAYDAAHDQFSRKSSESYAVRDIVDRALKRLDPSSAEYRAMAKYKAELDTLDNMRAQLDEAIKNGDRQAQTRLTNNIKTQRGILNRIENSASMKNVASMRDVTRLADDAKKLREMLKLQSRETNGTIAKQRSVNAAASEIMEKYGIKRGKGELAELLGNYYTKMMQSVNNETMTREAALDQAKEAAEWIARHVPDEIQYDDGAIEALDMLRGYKVKLNDNQRQNIRAKYDDINGWRRAVGGYITLSNEGKYLDELWPEWAERAPGYFTNEMISDADMPERLAEIIDSLKKSRETVIEVPGQYEYDLERAANDVYEAFWNIEPEQTVADKYAERIKTLKAEHNAMMSDLRKSFRDTIREERSEMYAEAKERAREYNEKLDLRRKVRKIKDDLTKRLDKPTIKKFVPKELRTATSELLSALNLVNEKNQPSQRTLERIAKLQAIYDSYKDENIVYDKQVSEWLSELRDTVGNKSISELTKDELKSVYKILKAFTKNITEVAQVKSLYASGVSTEKTVDVVAKEWMRNIERINPALSAYFNTMGKLLGRPELVFRIFGNMDRNSISTKVYDMMNAAQLEYNRIRQEGNRLFEEMFEGKENEKYLKELHDTKKLYDIGLKDTNGEPVKVTKDFALWLYRILMNENGIKHVSTTGGVMPDFKKYYNGGEAYGKKATRVVGFLTDKANDILDEVKEKSADIDEQIEQAKSEGDYGRVKELWKERDNIWSAWDQVRNDGREALLDTVQKKISDILTPQDKRFLELAAKFYDEWSKGYMNKASNERHGIDIADEENYTRIHTAEDYRGATLDSSNMESAIGTENMGFTKRRVGATNPIYFEGLSSAIAKHIDEVATYAAYLNPLYDLRKILNYTEGGINKSGTVRSKLNEKFGKGATNYIYRLAANVKGESFDKFGNVGFEKVFDELLGRVAEAALVANGRVVAYQAVSLLNAVTELGYGPVAHTVVAKLLKRADAELIAKYTPILEVRRSNGGTDEVANMKNAAKNHSIWYKITYPGTHAIQAMDLATVGKLWYASEYYVKKHNKSLKPGSEEFYRAVGKKMTEVVELTQPNYTPMQRNQLQRSKNPLARALAMFKTQPFQNLNNAIGASFQFAHDIAGVKNKTATVAEARESGAKLYRSISSLVISSAMMAVINAAWISLLLHGHWRWRDDETGEVSWEKFGEWFADEALNRLFGTDPLTSEAYNFIGSKIFDRKYYPGVSMPQVEVVTDALQSLSDSVDAMIDKKWNPKKEGREMATKIGRLFGIPVDSIAKPIEGVYMNVQDIINGEFGSFNYGNEYKSKQLAAQMLLALETDDEEKYEKARSKFPGTKTQTPEEQADAALKKAIGDMYIQGQYTYDETKEMLEEYLDKEEKEAEKQIDRWDYAKVHGNQDGYTVDWRDK